MADLETIGRAQRLRLLKAVKIGRVIHTENAIPVAHPVTFVLLGDEVTSAPAAERRWPQAKGAVFAFQADDIGSDGQRGWSVVGVGQAYKLTGSHPGCQGMTSTRSGSCYRPRRAARANDLKGWPPTLTTSGPHRHLAQQSRTCSSRDIAAGRECCIYCEIII
ncbi:pyridoxamine 5'-phosphate oxidase family protein [Pseudonocardia kujensis]|uniref:pyridoxamine 5'-phosphate oxidase family protein n=1 Tax=Pseudonocardia kujensis TaxID=1128675 RepID=UPI0035592A97